MRKLYFSYWFSKIKKSRRAKKCYSKTEDEDLILHYESELKKLYAEKGEISEKIELEKNRVLNPKKVDFEPLKNALELRKKWNVEARKKLIANIFPEWLPVTTKRHLWTPKLSLPYHISEVGKTDKNKMVLLRGIEPLFGPWEGPVLATRR